ncbi:deazaflavin-dependent oxidoreductase (nitroreductase family) [Nonomuraea polychroma]|uniref:Deazaflavin-dependent oxidoreductase (Nitroreductase family) n=1 Tax=Nonomuraea polychroma TaxID=46176 RepID=A0A438MHE0_9ACTN|nr:nitroreductase family deazaflavin-dependent oxidoreductase [Nonomuraea polychroma]RVX45163.1 deazaflavin-dependent oxidoreductase (nitroreductase family) [Nonomuraea polychroma]
MSELDDSPTAWVARHIREYAESDGERGHRKWGVNTLLFTVRGRATGKLRRTALIYGTDGPGRYVVVGSNGGLATHPAWYLNLLANPQVGVQVGPESLPARAAEATGADRERLWRMMAELWPQYDAYQDKLDRRIPVTVLERTSA